MTSARTRSPGSPGDEHHLAVRTSDDHPLMGDAFECEFPDLGHRRLGWDADFNRFFARADERN